MTHNWKKKTAGTKCKEIRLHDDMQYLFSNKRNLQTTLLLSFLNYQIIWLQQTIKVYSNKCFLPCVRNRTSEDFSNSCKKGLLLKKKSLPRKFASRRSEKDGVRKQKRRNCRVANSEWQWEPDLTRKASPRNNKKKTILRNARKPRTPKTRNKTTTPNNQQTRHSRVC